jgi:hypothetical protein
MIMARELSGPSHAVNDVTVIHLNGYKTVPNTLTENSCSSIKSVLDPFWFDVELVRMPGVSGVGAMRS